MALGSAISVQIAKSDFLACIEVFGENVVWINKQCTKKRGDQIMKKLAVLLGLAGMLMLGFLVFSVSPMAYAGDHLASSPPGCIVCHGTNVRAVHDYEDTIPIDCDICHFSAKTWYLNDDCGGLLTEGGIEVEEVEEGAWQLVTSTGYEFNFDCKACHVGDNPCHQN